MRDETLPPFGYQIEDKAEGAVVKQINYEDYLINKQREEALKAEKAEKARLFNLEKERKLAEEK